MPAGPKDSQDKAGNDRIISGLDARQGVPTPAKLFSEAVEDESLQENNEDHPGRIGQGKDGVDLAVHDARDEIGSQP